MQLVPQFPRTNVHYELQNIHKLKSLVFIRSTVKEWSTSNDLCSGFLLTSYFDFNSALLIDSKSFFDGTTA